MRMLAGGRTGCCVPLGGMAQCLPVAGAHTPPLPRFASPLKNTVRPGGRDPERADAVAPKEPPQHLHLDAPRRPRADLIEVPATTLIGKPARPHHALGFRSDAMQRWTREPGLDAERCMAPTLHRYTRIGRSACDATRATGDPQSTFGLQARCRLR